MADNFTINSLNKLNSTLYGKPTADYTLAQTDELGEHTVTLVENDIFTIDAVVIPRNLQDFVVGRSLAVNLGEYIGLTQQLNYTENGIYQLVELPNKYQLLKNADKLENLFVKFNNNDEIFKIYKDYSNNTFYVSEFDSYVEVLQEIKKIKPSNVEIFNTLELLEENGSRHINNVFNVIRDGVNNGVYRYDEADAGGSAIQSTAPELPDITVDEASAIDITAGTDLQGVVNNATNGQVFRLADGEYNFTNTFIIDKELTFVGTKDAVLIDNRGNSQNFVSIIADNVTIKGITIRHITTESNIGGCISVSKGFENNPVGNFRLIDCNVEFSKAGIYLKPENCIIHGNNFKLVGGSGTRRMILFYGNRGDTFVVNNTFNNNGFTANVNTFYSTSTTGNASEYLSGNLIIKGFTTVDNFAVNQFFLQDNWVFNVSAGKINYYFDGNIPNEKNLAIGFFVWAENQLNPIKTIEATNNTFTNNHASGGLGKGMVAFVGGGANTNSEEFNVSYGGNTILNEELMRADYTVLSVEPVRVARQNTVPTVNAILTNLASASQSGYIKIIGGIDV